MAERFAWAVSHNPGVMTTVDVRHSMGALWWPGSGAMVKRVGRVPNGSTPPLVVTATSPTPDGFVHVSPGYMVSMGTRSIAPYIQVLDAIKDINILSTPAHGSLTRWDLIIAQQNDELHSDADNTWTVKPVVGTPSATPSDPTVTGSPDYVVIARVVVTGGATSISQANITQLLTNFTVPIGGLLPVADQTARDALAGTRHDGMAVWRMDRDWVEVFDGSAWRVRGVAVCTSTADRDSAITSPYNGQLAVTTDLGILWRRHAGTWGTVNNNAGTTLDAREDTNGTTTSGAFTATLSGGTTCSGTFIAPASGKVDVFNIAQVGNSDNTDQAICAFEVRTGAVVGSGTIVSTAEIPNAVYSGPGKRGMITATVIGLTAGATYNIRQMFAVTGDTGSFSNKQLKVRPCA